MTVSTAIRGTLKALGYQGSSHFITSSSPELVSAVDYAHIFRKAFAECHLHGVYVLRPGPDCTPSVTPIVYVCEAADEAGAAEVHRRVWNQGLVPFVLVQTPRLLRLYSGFKYARNAGTAAAGGVLKATVAFDAIADELAAFKASAIDSGELWAKWGKAVDPDCRVEQKLLSHLKELDKWLQGQGLDGDTSHALIGKYVYLRYLHDRRILSPDRLGEWKLTTEEIFSRNATLPAFWRVNDELDVWLNGSVFPLTARKKDITAPHVQRVAAIFFGHQPDGQLHFDFQAYDFSFIPTETLSIIYQQFLHAPREEGKSKGKALGAYYTPAPLVNFVLEELHEKRPLREGMKVLDPACGSGAFLVQAYRRLIEQKRGKAKSKREKLCPAELRDLLTSHIFGVEKEKDACQVAELSLVLTLLDNVDPPDLMNNKKFKLPELHNQNIFEADFFNPSSTWAKSLEADPTKPLRFDWVIGNPPWKDLKEKSAVKDQPHAWKWKIDHRKDCPVGGNQLAEMFTWKVDACTSEDAVVGLVLPAMTLFKKESKPFRQRFFTQHAVWCVANFANLSEVLFAGRARRPAAVMFYRASPPQDDAPIQAFAPFVVNQEANRPDKPGRQKTTWTITVNYNELREVRQSEAATGDMRPWKLAMWGSYRDGELLKRMESGFPSLAEFAKRNGLVGPHQGSELRHASAKGTKHRPDLAGEKRLVFMKLRKCGRRFFLPDEYFDEIPDDEAYLRIRGGEAGVEVSKPPHIIIDAARRFAVYRSNFVWVSARQIGLAGPQEKADLLKALSLYLSSDFAIYYQFFQSPAWGVDTSQAILDALHCLPVPLEKFTSAELERWVGLHAEIEAASAAADSGQDFALMSEGGEEQRLHKLLVQLNSQVYSLLGLRSHEIVLVEDLVRTRKGTLQGKVTKEATARPTPGQMTLYLKTLKQELDAFLDDDAYSHNFVALCGSNSSMLQVDLVKNRLTRPEPRVVDVDSPTARGLEQVRRQLLQRHGQWLYYDRGLRIYQGSRSYVFKPLQYIHWTRTQALLDADELIAETLVGTED